MICPSFLLKNDVIGVTAPSNGVSDPLDVIRFKNAVSTLESKGYKVKLTENVFSDMGDGRSSPAIERAEQLESLIYDKDVKYIVSAKGGDFLNEIFETLDLSGIKDNPKWIQGYSDNTDILMEITTKYDVMSIYCGNFGDFGMRPWHRSISENIEFIEGIRKEQVSFDTYESGFKDRFTGLEPIDGDLDVNWISDGNISFTGTLIGGCSDKLEEIVGTERDHISEFKERNGHIIWYMETFASNDDSIEKMLKKMDSADWFSDTSGIIFGRPMFYEGNYIKTVKNFFEKYEIPLIFDADIGHKAPRMTIINGAKATVLSSEGKGKIVYHNLN